MRQYCLLPALVLLACASAAHADADKTWTTDGAAGFASGKLEGVSVLSTGEVTLAPTTVQVEGIEAEFVWDVETGADGTAYVATGGPAAVYAVSGGRARLLYKSDQKHILSVLPMPDGTVLAAAAPNGTVSRISRHGKATTVADFDFPYVWDMALDSKGRVYCATGPEGRLLELSKSGKPKELLKVEQKNLMCVAVGRDDAVYVGTDTDGYVYRVVDGAASVLYDAEESEVHDLVVGADGALYACTAQSQSAGGPSGPSAERPEAGGKREEEPPAPGSPSAYNSIYRIVPEQGATLLVRFPRMLVLSLAARGDDVFAGTGTGGRVMAVKADATSRIVTDLKASHVSAMAAAPDGNIVVGTSNPGALWTLGNDLCEEGTLVSRPFDAAYMAKWGRVWWTQRPPDGKSVRIKLRTGNSGKPDEHWSEWTEWAVRPEGGPAGAPMGRFAQFSAELGLRRGSEPPELLAVNVSYRQSNRRPEIGDLVVDGQSLLDGDGNGEPNGSRPPQGSVPQRPSRAPNVPPARRIIAWKAADPNDDKLTAELHYRGLDEEQWKPLEADVSDKPNYAWDTSRVPDGLYLLRLTVSDSPERPAGEAMSAERIGRPLLIDNRSPAVVELAGEARKDGSYKLVGVARDSVSRIARIEVSRNAEDWAPVFPSDGILDSREEAFSYVAEPLEPGEHVFVFAATDEQDNTGSGKLVVVVEAAD